MELLSIDCLTSIFRLLSVQNLYNLYATGDSSTSNQLRHAVTILDFYAAFETKHHSKCESSKIRAPVFWHFFLNVRQICIHDSTPLDGFTIPRQILLSLENFSIARRLEMDTRKSYNSMGILSFSVQCIGYMPKLMSLDISCPEMTDLLSLNYIVVNNSFPNTLTILRLLQFELDLSKHRLPPQLQEFYFQGALTLRPASYPFGDLETIMSSSNWNAKGYIRDEGKIQFPNTLLIFDVWLTSDCIDSDYFMMKLSLSMPNSLQTFAVTSLVGPETDDREQMDFVHLLPPDIRHLRVHEHYGDLSGCHMPLELKHLPPKLETLYWHVQPDCEDEIELSCTLRFISFSQGWFDRQEWPHVKFSNPDLRIANVRVDKWPKVLDEAGHMIDFAEKNLIHSFYHYDRAGEEYDISPSYIPPNITKICVSKNDLIADDEFNHIPNNILYLELTSPPPTLSILPSNLTKLRITLCSTAVLHNIKSLLGSTPPILPRTLRSLTINQCPSLPLDLATSCPNLESLKISSVASSRGFGENGVYLNIVSLPPRLRKLLLSGFWLSNLSQIFSNLTENIEFCHLVIDIGPVINHTTLRNIVPSHLGANSECGWSFKLVSEHNSNHTDFDLSYFIKQLAKNRHLNFANVVYLNSSLASDLSSQDASKILRSPEVEGGLEYYKRRDISERRNVRSNGIREDHSSSKKRDRCVEVVAEENCEDDEDEPSPKRPKNLNKK